MEGSAPLLVHYVIPKGVLSWGRQPWLPAIWAHGHPSLIGIDGGLDAVPELLQGLRLAEELWVREGKGQGGSSRRMSMDRGRLEVWRWRSPYARHWKALAPAASMAGSRLTCSQLKASLGVCLLMPRPRGGVACTRPAPFPPPFQAHQVFWDGRQPAPFLYDPRPLLHPFAHLQHTTSATKLRGDEVTPLLKRVLGKPCHAEAELKPLACAPGKPFRVEAYSTC